jgi:hypothetical protein
MTMSEEEKINQYGRHIQFFNHKTKVHIQAVEKRLNKMPTLNVSVCPNDGANTRWENKVTIQVNPEKELPEVAKCLIKKQDVFEAGTMVKKKTKAIDLSGARILDGWILLFLTMERLSFIGFHKVKFFILRR